jgi:histidinol-phosphate aminotransferase
VQRDASFGVNIKAVQAAVDNHTRLIFLANPNAPTGNLTPEADIKQVLELGLPTVVDEAYYEFSGTTVIPLMEHYSNLMVVRTFSKWSGLAGLRLGYGLFSPEIAGWLHRIKIPYNVNVAALVAVRESLLDLDYLIRQVKLIVAERKRLFNRLQQIEWLRPYPSVANFILCLQKRGNAKDVQQKLQDKGILVRYFDKPRLENCIRISVGTPSDTNALIKALQEIGAKL